ncbi:uracil-DNA glycosylase [Amaricoccus tamworthensis]|uniref:uracil-DNA glycosylase n=1 Tax=Amaricoccus tamworthensis TaxID=57002 RepID=UPI003C7A2EB0
MNGLDPAREADIATLRWLVELGVDEAIGEEPVNRFEEPKLQSQPLTTPPKPKEDVVIDTAPIAAACDTLDALRNAVEQFEGCDLKKGARNLVFSGGKPWSRVMVIGGSPDRDEDRAGAPFVGRAGEMLDRMFAAIGLSREAENPEQALYLTSLLPWRPPQGRQPSARDIDMMLPFLARHVELAEPKVVVLMGDLAAGSALKTQTRITRLRGTWGEFGGRPAIPMFHPEALLRDGSRKRAAWSDLLEIHHRLEAIG